MTWDELQNIRPDLKHDGQVLTDIECPECGKQIYLNDRIILTSYPVKYSYWCTCGWCGTSHFKWHKEYGG